VDEPDLCGGGRHRCGDVNVGPISSVSASWLAHPNKNTARLSQVLRSIRGSKMHELAAEAMGGLPTLGCDLSVCNAGAPDNATDLPLQLLPRHTGFAEWCAGLLWSLLISDMLGLGPWCRCPG
jgi:hypothetical protein